MKAQKHIMSYQDIDLDIVEVTLLSAEEYRAYRDIIKPRKDWWWLRSPYSGYEGSASSVYGYGILSSDNVENTAVGVSPALRIRNLESLGMNP